jgi:hypothetical protein
MDGNYDKHEDPHFLDDMSEKEQAIHVQAHKTLDKLMNNNLDSLSEGKGDTDTEKFHHFLGREVK